MPLSDLFSNFLLLMLFRGTMQGKNFCVRFLDKWVRIIDKLHKHKQEGRGEADTDVLSDCKAQTIF